jgi:iron complex transport system ATP-binding protein
MRRTLPARKERAGRNPTGSTGSTGTRAPVLSCVDVGLRLAGTTVLGGLTLDAAAGEWIVLLGPNGAGKSSALRVLSGSLRSSRRVVVDGRVSIHGVSLGELSQRDVGRTVAVVPQSPIFPIGMSTYEYVLLGRTPHLGPFANPGPEDREIVEELMKRLDLDAFQHRTLTSLSGGERQRAVIARALAQHAPVLVLDEPTSALDVGHQQQVLELVDTLREEHGLVVISAMHDLSLAGQYAHKLVLLNAGSVLTHGSPRSVLETESLRKIYDAHLHSVDLPSGHVAVLPMRER